MASEDKTRSEDPNVKAFAATANDEKANSLADSVRSVLSIQSTVVYGICGNKAATFPMQLFGFDVSPINTVQFSNHTGYPTFKGSTTTGDEMNELVSGMMSNNLLEKFKYIVSGYMGSVSIMEKLGKLFENIVLTHEKELKTEDASKLNINELAKLFKKHVFFACDPACGDNGKLYSDAFLPFIKIYYQNVIPFASLLAPNETEAVYLINQQFAAAAAAAASDNNSDKKFEINSLLDGFVACLRFHNMGVRFVVITSIENKDNNNVIDVIYSDMEVSNGKSYYSYGHLVVPKIKGYYVGTGDLTTALLFSWINLLKSDSNIENISDILDASVLNTMKSLQLVIKRTQTYNSKELILFASKDSVNDLLSPNDNYTKLKENGTLSAIKAEKIQVEKSKVDQIYQQNFGKN